MWKGWRTFLCEMDKAISNDLQQLMSWFMVAKANIDLKVGSLAEFPTEMLENLQKKRALPPPLPSYAKIMSKINRRYNRFLHKHTYLKGISDFVFQNLETEEIEIKVFVQNLYLHATLKTKGLEQMFSLSQFEGVDLSKYYNN